MAVHGALAGTVGLATGRLEVPTNASGTDTPDDGSKRPSSAPASVVSDVIAKLFPSLTSYSSVIDWLKFLLLGGCLETARRLLSYGYKALINAFFITASFNHRDTSYSWLLVWLSKNPAWTLNKARSVQISTLSSTFASSTVDFSPYGNEEQWRYPSTISFLPLDSLTYSLWYRGRWMTISRVECQSQGYFRTELEYTLHVTILSRDPQILVDLLKEARDCYVEATKRHISVCTTDSMDNWRILGSKTRRSMDSIVLDPGIKDLLLNDAHEFLHSQDWYAERGIPFRRGYLLYGTPGSGKTSMVHCMAGELGLDIYVLSLSRNGLDDAGLVSLIDTLPSRCIALIEDIDAAFTHSVSRGEPQDRDASLAGPTPLRAAGVSLSGLLNALDGVGAQEGRILFATTNDYAALDPALCRPGRMDIHVEFRNASRAQARELFERFYLPTETGSSAAAVERAEEALFDLTEKAVSSRVLYRRCHDAAQIAKLAQDFADAIPERELSMASLQGYLMTHKTGPDAACAGIHAWAEGERKQEPRLREMKAENERERATQGLA